MQSSFNPVENFTCLYYPAALLTTPYSYLLSTLSTCAEEFFVEQLSLPPSVIKNR